MCGVAFRGSREPTPGIWGVLEEFLRVLEEFLRVQSEMGGLRVWCFRNRLHVLNQPFDDSYRKGQSYTLQNPNLYNYYPKTEYLIIGSFGPLGVCANA